MRTKLVIISVAPTSSTIESAISVTTRDCRRRPARTPVVVPRPPSLSVSVSVGDDACSAGSRPKMNPVATVTASV